MKLLRTLLKTLNIISDVVEDPRFNDPEFDPLRDLLQKRKEAPDVKPEPDKRALAVRKIMEAFEHGEWRRVDGPARSHATMLSITGMGYYCAPCPFEMVHAPLKLSFDGDISPSWSLKRNGSDVDFLTYKEKKQIDEIWRDRENTRLHAEKDARDACAVNEFLGDLT